MSASAELESAKESEPHTRTSPPSLVPDDGLAAPFAEAGFALPPADPSALATVYRRPLRHPVNESVRAATFRRTQQMHGNRVVQRVAGRAASAPWPRAVQRKCACGGTCDDCRQLGMKPEEPAPVWPATFDTENAPRAVQREAESGASETGGQEAASRLMADSPAQPLDASPRLLMEAGFGRDLSDVRVHTDAPAAGAAAMLQAAAFTTGSDIYFGESRFDPASADGQQLLAHEIAHTIQQSEGRAPSGGGTNAPFVVAPPDSPLEHEADRSAEHVVSGEPSDPPSVNQSSTATQTLIQRNENCGTPDAPMSCPPEEAEENCGTPDAPMSCGPDDSQHREELRAHDVTLDEDEIFTLAVQFPEGIRLEPEQLFVTATGGSDVTSARTRGFRVESREPISAGVRTYILRVGKARSILASSTGGPSVLFDAGSERAGIVARSLNLLAAAGEAALPGRLQVSHTDADHINEAARVLRASGMENASVEIGLQQYRNAVGQADWARAGIQLQASQSLVLIDVLQANGVHVRRGVLGNMEITEFRLVEPAETLGAAGLTTAQYRRQKNASSPVTIVQDLNTGKTQVFTGDATGRAMGEIVDAVGDEAFRRILGGGGRNLALAEVPHHGGKVGSGPDAAGFLRMLRLQFEASDGTTRYFTQTSQSFSAKPSSVLRYLDVAGVNTTQVTGDQPASGTSVVRAEGASLTDITLDVGAVRSAVALGRTHETEIMQAYRTLHELKDLEQRGRALEEALGGVTARAEVRASVTQLLTEMSASRTPLTQSLSDFWRGLETANATGAGLRGTTVPPGVTAAMRTMRTALPAETMTEIRASLDAHERLVGTEVRLVQNLIEMYRALHENRPERIDGLKKTQARLLAEAHAIMGGKEVRAHIRAAWRATRAVWTPELFSALSNRVGRGARAERAASVQFSAILGRSISRQLELHKIVESASHGQGGPVAGARGRVGAGILAGIELLRIGLELAVAIKEGEEAQEVELENREIRGRNMVQWWLDLGVVPTIALLDDDDDPVGAELTQAQRYQVLQGRFEGEVAAFHRVVVTGVSVEDRQYAVGQLAVSAHTLDDWFRLVEDERHARHEYGWTPFKRQGGKWYTLEWSFEEEEYQGSYDEGVSRQLDSLMDVLRQNQQTSLAGEAGEDPSSVMSVKDTAWVFGEDRYIYVYGASGGLREIDFGSTRPRFVAAASHVWPPRGMKLVKAADAATYERVRAYYWLDTQTYIGVHGTSHGIIPNTEGLFFVDEDDTEPAGPAPTAEEAVQRSAAADGDVSPDSLARAAADASPGDPLAPAVRGEAEDHLQLDADRVRIHDDSDAHGLAADLGARAFTRGEHVYFAAGQYAPDSAGGRALLGHELTHVAQQQAAGVPVSSSRIEPSGSALERQAVDAGNSFAVGAPASRPASSSGGTPGIFRDEGMGTAEDLIDRFTSWGNLDESGLGRKLSDLCWMSPAHYPLVAQVMDELAGFNRDDVARGFAAATPDVRADEFAATDAGRKMLRRLISEMAGGFTWGEDAELAIRLYSALARREGADEGKKRGLDVLDKAAAAPLPARVARSTPVLPISELQNRMRLVGEVLGRLANRHAKDSAVLRAVAGARATLADKRQALSVDNANQYSIDVPDAQAIAGRVEEVLLNLDLQLAQYRADSSEAVRNESMIALTERVREAYVRALSLLLQSGAVDAFEHAEAVAASLPRALTEAQLAFVELRRPGFSLLEGSYEQLVAWIGVVRADLDRLETDARELRAARERQEGDVKEREERFVNLQHKIELSLEAIAEWDKAFRAYEYLATGVNLIYTAYGSIATLLERFAAMRDAAYAGDLATLRSRVEAHRNDPNVAIFYKNMPVFISASQLMVSLGITLVAAIATAGIGGAFAGSLGTAVTTGGRLLTFAGTAAVEALTFTVVSRGLQSVAPGQQPQGSALVDLAWNFGLFLLLRGVSGGITRGLQVRGLEILATPLNLTAAGTILQGYGILRFSIEQGRFPTDDELATMTVTNLIMLLGITLGTRAVHKAFEARDAYRTLKTFQHKYVWRFEGLELGRQGLLNKFRTALDQGKGADPQTLAELREAGKLIEDVARELIADVKADKSISLETARKELGALGFDTMEGSQELLTRSLGLPEAVGLRQAGPLDQYTYGWGQTNSLERGLVALGGTVEKTVDAASGLRTLSATFGDRPPLTFAERPSYFPAKGEVEIDPTDASLLSLLADFTITDPAAQRFVVRLLAIELSKHPGHGTASAAKPVRKQLKLYEATAHAEGKSTEQVVLEARNRGLAAAAASDLEIAAADALQANGILKSPEWLASRDAGNFRGTVTEWLAVEDISSTFVSGEVLLRNVRFLGDLYTDAALTTPLLDSQSGRPLRGVDVGSELDFLSVIEAGGMFEYQTLFNAKGYASGGGAAAARQNAQALDLLRGAESGTVVEVTLSSGEKAFAQVQEIWGIDSRTHLEIELTGRLTEASVVTQETIGLKQKGSTHTRQLPYDSKQIDRIVNLLRERQLMSTSDY